MKARTPSENKTLTIDNFFLCVDLYFRRSHLVAED